MNCPSRNDDVSEHPGWNQSPPFLSADATTINDLNGVVNQRELEKSSKGSVGLFAAAGGGECQSLLGIVHHHDRHAQAVFRPFGAALSRDWAPNRGREFSHPAWWLSPLLLLSCTASYLWGSLSAQTSGQPVFKMELQDAPVPATEPFIKSLSKRSTCGDDGINADEYDVPFHVGALVIILFVSSSACAFPMLAIRFPSLRVPPSFLFVVRHFGTGVLIATAFVHLLPTAFISLGDPCLSDFWTTDYPAMPGAIALVAILLVTVVEMVFSPGRKFCGAGYELTSSPNAPNELEAQGDANISKVDESGDTKAQERYHATTATPKRGLLGGRASSISRELSHISCELPRMDGTRSGNAEDSNMNAEAKAVDVEASSCLPGPIVLTPEQRHKKAIVQCMLLELGILFHSIFIGMALSVSVGFDFIVLLIAVTFHQTFEGLALGSRIASIDWRGKRLQPWLMALAYGCTTPLGQAIGLATHTLYSPTSEVGLLMVGIMNAISSGLLVFASLVELMAEDFLCDESWRLLRGKRRVYACVLVFLGAFGMSLIGAWA